MKSKLIRINLYSILSFLVFGLIISMGLRVEALYKDESLILEDHQKDLRSIRINVIDMPLEIKSGEKLIFRLEIFGEYEDLIKNISYANVSIEADGFSKERSYRYEGGINYIYSTVAKKGKGVLRIFVNYKDKSASKIYEINIKPRDAYADFQNISLFAGLYGSYGVDASIQFAKPNVFVNGSLYLRNNFDPDKYIIGLIGLELGPRIYINKVIGELNAYYGINVGVSDSSVGYGYLFGPSQINLNAFVSPYFGITEQIGVLKFFSQYGSFIYNQKSFSMLKIGAGL